MPEQNWGISVCVSKQVSHLGATPGATERLEGKHGRLARACSGGHPHSMCAWQGRLQSQDLGKHLTGVEDLLQLHELVEADIAVQAERVRAVSASALRFCNPGKGEKSGKALEREGLGRSTSRAEVEGLGNLGTGKKVTKQW